MKIQKQVTIGEQFGQVSVEEDGQITLDLVNLKGRLQLSELQAVVRQAADLNSRINPPAKKPTKKKTRRR